MRNQHVLALVAVVAIAASLGMGKPALACTCAPPLPVPEAVANSHSVFRGVVTSIEPAGGTFLQYFRVTLDVNAWWKGALTPTSVVFTEFTTCQFLFQVGREYLVFTRWDVLNSRERTDVCTRTHGTFAGDPDIAALGPPLMVGITAKPWSNVKSIYR